ncbi:MAG: RDD family protein [Psychrosphaera sp.]|nr:RDD family protein [Psychrosphaera sp.]
MAENNLPAQPSLQQSQENDPYSNLSEDETKSIITPHAFTVDSTLFGIALASPARRGIAMAIDVALIGILAKQNVAFLAIVAAATFFKVGSNTNKPKKWRKTRKLFRWLSLLMLMIFIFEGIGPVYNQITGQDEQSTEQDSSQGDESSVTTVLLSGLKYAGFMAKFEEHKDDDQCIKDKCWRVTADTAAETMAQDNLDEETFLDIVSGFIAEDELDLSEDEQAVELARLKAIYAEHYAKQTAEVVDEKTVGATEDASATEQEQVEQAQEKSSASNVTEWIKGIIVDDLGFGFGWAAFYFTLFTAWWHGQTPGKRIAGIRVIQLDGTRLGLWDSFGRYGGYGAGFATGLLGFFQIYWDTNRQAIQDKISATVVIRGDLPEVREADADS